VIPLAAPSLAPAELCIGAGEGGNGGEDGGGGARQPSHVLADGRSLSSVVAPPANSLPPPSPFDPSVQQHAVGNVEQVRSSSVPLSRASSLPLSPVWQLRSSSLTLCVSLSMCRASALLLPHFVAHLIASLLTRALAPFLLAFLPLSSSACYLCPRCNPALACDRVLVVLLPATASCLTSHSRYSKCE
jgi:hypothetical protein